MADPRITAVDLDDKTIIWRNADVEQERRIAIFDLLEENHFRPERDYPQGYAGPFRIRLRVEEGRLAIDIFSDDEQRLETLIWGSAAFAGRSRTISRSATAITSAIRQATPQQIPPPPPPPRDGGHGAARHPQRGRRTAEERLQGKIDVDFDTARRLFTLICVLHIRG